MMVPHDFLLKCIAPLQDHSRLTWLYTGVNDTTQLEHSDRSDLDDATLAFALMKLSPYPTSHDFITPPTSYQPLCMDQAARMLLLVVMPSLDDVGIAMVQRGD
jgi:hypothetical protein